MPTITQVLDAAELARQRGSVYLCAELLELAGAMLAYGVQDSTNAVARMAYLAISDRMPMAATTRHHYLEGATR